MRFGLPFLLRQCASRIQIIQTETLPSFTTPSGERVRCSAATEDKTQAQEFHDKLKAESWRVVKLGDKPKRTWDEAAYKWLVETQHKKTHHDDVAKIRFCSN